ncbi:MAG: uroporphyrinogen decarboxylase family protein [Promethearchaeota archaeon]
MNIDEIIVTALKREEEPPFCPSFVQGIMPAFSRAFDDKYGDILDEEDIVLLPGKDIVLHKKLGFDSSWYGFPGPPIHYGEKHDILLKELDDKQKKINPNYHVSTNGGLYKQELLMGFPHNFQVDGLLKTKELWEEWHEDFSVGTIPEHNVDQVNEAYNMGLENDFLIIPSMGLLMEPLIGSIGIDSIARFAYRDPHFLKKICDTIMIQNLKKMEFACKTEVPVVLIADDCAYKGRPILSPKMYKKFILPNFKKMIDIAHQHGKMVIFHSDGYVEPYYNLLISIHLDAHESLEPTAGMDLKHLKQEYGGKLSLIGNMDCSRLLPYGSIEEVVSETKKCLENGMPGGGYMFSPCTDLTDSCKLSNVEAMMETYKKYRNYQE